MLPCTSYYFPVCHFCNLFLSQILMLPITEPQGSISVKALFVKHKQQIFPAVPRCSQFSSVQFSRSVVSNSLRPHESQHARPPCPSPTPGVHSDSRPSSQRRHPAISSSVVPFSSCPQSLPASESFPMSQLFTSLGQSTGVSALASVLPMNTQG